MNWGDIDYQYMTDESSCSEDDEKIVQISLPWRSEGWKLKLCVCVSCLLFSPFCSTEQACWKIEKEN